MAGALPPGWAAHLDPGSGRTFYYKEATGETSWEIPQPEPAAAGAPAAASGALPDGWAEHLDAGSGRTFFYNAGTGETSWDRPQATSATAAPAPAASSALPEGWAEHVDPGSGRTFYHNVGTGETAWEKPAAPAASSGWSKLRGSLTSASAPTAAALAPLSNALPEGWVEHVDPGSGRAFYCKAATGETSWDRPAPAPSTGTWATSQANDLGCDPRPSLHVLRQRTEVLSHFENGQISGLWSSVQKVTEALNNCTLVVSGGLAVIYSSSKNSYWLLWRSDKDKEAESVITAFG